MPSFFPVPTRPVLAPANETALKAIPSALLLASTIAVLADSGDLARYFPTSTDAPSPGVVWKPDDKTLVQQGRWKLYASATGGVIGGGASSPDFADPVIHVNSGGAVPSTGLYGISVDFTLGANRRGIFWDAASAHWAAAEDTLGDDTTISSYLDFRAKDVLAESFTTSAGGTASSGAIRLAQNDEMKSRIGASTYRMLAALSGPKVALGDTTLSQLTADAAALVQITSQLAVQVRAGSTYSLMTETGGSTLVSANPTSGTFDVLGRSRVYNGASLFFDMNAASAAAQLNGKIDIYDSTGTTLFFEFDPGSATSVLTIRKSGIGTTKTIADDLGNTTVSGTQVSPQRNQHAFHSGGTRLNVGEQVEPQSASRVIKRWVTGTGTTAPATTAFFFDSSDPNYGASIQCGTHVATNGGNGFRLANNGGGVKEDGSQNAIFQSAAAGSFWSATSSTSTSNSGPRFQFTADAGTPSNGYLARFGYGSGSFTTSVLDLYYNGRLGLANVDPTAAGQIGMNTTTGRTRVFTTSSGAAAAARSVATQDEVLFAHVATAVDVTAALGQFIEVDTSASVTVTLPAIPSGVSERSSDICVVDSKGNAVANNVRIVPDGSNTIKGTNLLLIASAYGGVRLKHNGQTGANGQWFVL